MAWAIQQLYDNRELCWRMYGFDQLENQLAQGGRLDFAEYTSYNGNKANAILYGGDAEALFAAMKEDFFAGRIGARWVTGDRWGADQSDEYLYFSSSKQEGAGYKNYYISIAVSGTASSTRAALGELADRAVWQSDGSWDGGESPGEIIVEPTTIFG